ncbi:MAG: hypothetical protein JXJ30_07515, partial [Halothiobacillaceae bacterium]|nr:hypothetical protein [Halothiobacillaceae bacterium]
MPRASRILIPALAALGLGAGAALAAGTGATTQTNWINPVVKDYGRMHPVTYGALKPDPNKTW